MDDTQYNRVLKREERAFELHQRPKGMRRLLRWLRVHGRLWEPWPDTYYVRTLEERDPVLRDRDLTFCTGNGKFAISRLKNTHVRWMQSLSVQVDGSATLEVRGPAHRGWASKIFVAAYDQAKITAYGNIVVFASDQTQVEGHDWADIRACDEAKVTAYDEALVAAGDRADVEAFDGAYVEVGGRARVRAHDDTRVDAYEGATVVADGTASVFATVPENVEIHGNATLEPWEIDRE